jgi:hypothetical protein
MKRHRRNPTILSDDEDDNDEAQDTATSMGRDRHNAKINISVSYDTTRILDITLANDS